MRALTFDRTAPNFRDRIVKVGSLWPENILLPEGRILAQSRPSVLLSFVFLTAIDKHLHLLTTKSLELFNRVLLETLDFLKLALK